MPTLSLHFPENGWEKISQNWSAWWAGELERPLIVLECIEPQYYFTPHYASTFLGNYSSDLSATDLLELFMPRLQATHYLGDAFPRFWPNFGPGIVAAFAGANLRPGKDTTWFSPGEGSDITSMQVKRKADNRWWQRVKTVTQTAVAWWGEQLSIGFTDLGGNLDILAHLRGMQQLLVDLLDRPEQVDRLVQQTNQQWLQCYEELYQLTSHGRGITCWGPCWSATRGYQLQSDFSTMISPKMFERYVLPDLATCCRALDYPFYHLDGKGQIPHLEMLLCLEGLRGIQWVPGDGQPQAEQWLALIRRIRQAGKLCQVYVSAQGALTILKEMEGKGLLLVIDEALNPAQGQAFLDALHSSR
jgi:hypothetical protein